MADDDLQPGCRSSAPLSARRSVWIAVSACQPQADSAMVKLKLPGSHRSRRSGRLVWGCRDGGRSAGQRRRARQDRLEPGSSRKRPSVAPFTSAPWKPRSLTVRSSSSAAASGASIGRCAKPRKRPGGGRRPWPTRRYRRVPARCRLARHEVGPGPATDSTCTVIPLASMSSRRARRGRRVRCVW